EVEFKWDTYHKNTLEAHDEFEDDLDDDDWDEHPNVFYTKE
ncbi:MAG: GTPase ObgE, partial [Pelagibaca sp.]|nr:GTPase ObgE [Pelagibaca sp.]